MPLCYWISVPRTEQWSAIKSMSWMQSEEKWRQAGWSEWLETDWSLKSCIKEVSVLSNIIIFTKVFYYCSSPTGICLLTGIFQYIKTCQSWSAYANRDMIQWWSCGLQSQASWNWTQREHRNGRWTQGHLNLKNFPVIPIAAVPVFDDRIQIPPCSRLLWNYSRFSCNSKAVKFSFISGHLLIL